jgi:hypothetical protein
MPEQRLKTLTGTGAVFFDTRFATKAATTLTGNVTLTLGGLDNGGVVTIWATQDATGSRTFTISPTALGANVVVGPGTAIKATASSTTKIVIANVNGIYNVEWVG